MIARLRDWLGTTRHRTVDWDGSLPWWNCCYEAGDNERWRFMAGDLLADMEGEAGGVGSVQFGIDLDLCQSDVPEFHLRGFDRQPDYDVHNLTLIFWRWGIYLSIRGNAMTGTFDPWAHAEHYTDEPWHEIQYGINVGDPAECCDPVLLTETREPQRRTRR